MPIMKPALAWISAAFLAVGVPASVPTAVPAPHRVAIVGAKLFPSPDAPAIENAVILIEGGVIVGVGPTGWGSVSRHCGYVGR